MSAEPALLEVRGVRRRFGGLRAVDGMDLDVRRGELVGLIGPNGAGKTTLFNLLSGFLRPDAGSIAFAGRRIERLPTHRRARLGLVRTFQITRALQGMTVLDNLLVAPPHQRGERLAAALAGPGVYRRQEDALRERALETLRFVDLEPLASEFAGALSGGQKRLLELARALMTEPTMVLLDEPLAGVNPTLARRIMEKIEALRERGLTILLIEHDIETVFGRCPRVVVMAQGRRLAEGTGEEVRSDPRVVEAYLGGGAAQEAE